MAIADTINSIRTHLETDYEALENIGAELENVDKNIENIASVVNGIYDNLPKTTGEDTNLSLTTLKGKMGIIPKGDTQQYSTTGANLLSKDKLNTSTTIQLTYLYKTRYKLVTSTSGNALIFRNLNLPSGNYVVSIQVTSGTYSGGNLVVRNTSATNVVEGSVSSTRINLQVTSSTIGDMVLWNVASGLNVEFDIQISSGTSEQPFEEYTRKYC